MLDHLLAPAKTKRLASLRMGMSARNNLVLASAGAKNNGDISKRILTSLIDGPLPWHVSKSNELKEWHGVAHAVWLAHIPLGTNAIPALSSVDKPPFGNMNPAHTWFSKCYAGEVPISSLESISALVIRHQKVNRWVLAFSKSPEHVLYRDVLIEVFKAEDCPALKLTTLIQCYMILSKNSRCRSLGTIELIAVYSNKIATLLFWERACGCIRQPTNMDFE